MTPRTSRRHQTTAACGRERTVGIRQQFFLYHRNRTKYTYDELHQLGFPSLTSFLREHESIPLIEIAVQIGGDRLAAAQLESLWQTEIVSDTDLEYYLKSALVRKLRQQVPNGIRKHGRWALILAATSWGGGVGAALDAWTTRVGERLLELDGIADDWQPVSIEDPVLKMIFCEPVPAGALRSFSISR